MLFFLIQAQGFNSVVLIYELIVKLKQLLKHLNNIGAFDIFTIRIDTVDAHHLTL